MTTKKNNLLLSSLSYSFESNPDETNIDNNNNNNNNHNHNHNHNNNNNSNNKELSLSDHQHMPLQQQSQQQQMSQDQSSQESHEQLEELREHKYPLHEENNNNNDIDLFKIIHNQYKRQQRPNDPYYINDIKDMIDFHSNDWINNNSESVILIKQKLEEKQQPNDTNKYNYSGPIYGLKEFPGFLYYPSAISIELQELLAYRSLRTYCEIPHRTNIIINNNNNKNIGNSDRRYNDSIHANNSSHNNSSSSNNRHHDDNTNSNMNDTMKQCFNTKKQQEKTMWEIRKEEYNQQDDDMLCHQNKNNKKQKKKHNNNNKDTNSLRYFDKLSWSTMGYHYDWTKRSYDRNIKSNIPYELIQLSQYFALPSLLLSSSCTNTNTNTTNPSLSYEPTACIVNYYHNKSVMGGHRDDLEEVFNKPVVSISLGRPCVFILGNITKTQSKPIPVPILIRSGDVLVLGGSSRLSYHSMARILPYISTSTSSSPCNNNNNIHNDDSQNMKGINNDIGTKTTTMKSDNHLIVSSDHQIRIHDVVCHDNDQINIMKHHHTDSCCIMNHHNNNDHDHDEQNTSIIPSIEDKIALKAFMMEHRININLRQVYEI